MPSDLDKISACHRICFSNSFSTKLGTAVTVKTFEWFLAAENRFLFHISHNDQVIGYIGGLHPQYNGDGSTSGMMRYAMKEATVAISKKPWLIFSKEAIAMYPLIFKNIYHKVFKVSHNNNAGDISNAADFQNRIGLVVIGVHPGYRGKGIFELLIKQFEHEALLRKVSKLTLSVKTDNRHAINAYKKAGWLIAREHRNSVEMYKMQE